MDENNKLEFASRLDLGLLQKQLAQVRSELQKVIVGQEKMIDYLLVALLSNGHVLLEGVPGIAKTITVKLLSKALDIGFSRIQFTPDLMPSDVLGTSVFDLKKSEFEFKKGPIFSNLILIDEINRAPAKTQAALFEVMEERQITIDGLRFKMQPPFLVIATQNTRENSFLYLGASPRASLAMLNAAKGFAVLAGRDFVTPEDIKQAAYPVLGHRVILAPEKEMEGIRSEQIIQQIIESVAIPR